jgi:proteasome accessory factor B
VTAEQIRAEVYGYPDDQDDAAFFRMFERDKKDLGRMGFAIESDTEGNYVLDAGETYSTAIDLTPAEAAAVRIAASALLDDPSFPFAGDLRLALAKVAAEVGVSGTSHVAAHLADEDPTSQGAAVAVLSAAANSGKRVSFDYTNSRGVSAFREIEPYGLFLHDGRWYLVGRDTAKGDVRTFTVGRMGPVTANTARPETPDFDRPSDFDIARYIRLPFQFGDLSVCVEAHLRFEPEVAWRARALAAGQGELTATPDGAVEWRVIVASPERLLRFVIENGPGIRVLAPEGLVTALESGRSKVVALHG